MQNERKRILAMLENGTITTDEALTLLEKLGQNQKVEQKSIDMDNKPNEERPEINFEKEKRDESKSSEQPSMDDFLDDLRKDFTHVGDRFMQFMQTAVQKVKSIDFETSFGHSIVFDHTITKAATDIKELVVDIDNGKLTLHTHDANEIRADFSVKKYTSETEQVAKDEFLDKLLFMIDAGKCRISSDFKMMQVNINLFVPKKDYDRISARLLNGSFQMKDVDAKKVRVKTANGKITVSKLSFEQAEFETANGEINLTEVTGGKLEAEALNGRVYIDGALRDVEAQSLNGHVVVTTTDVLAENIEAKTVSGSVEIYIPSNIALSGEIGTNMGRLDMQLSDITRTSEQEQLLHRTIRFKKEVEGNTSPLHIFGEAKTGSVLVCYNAKQV